MKYNRAYRRERLSHIKKVVRDNFSVIKNLPCNDVNKFIGRIASSRSNCSCWMCGNPRKFFNQRTIKEISDINLMKLEMKYINKLDI